MVTPEEARSLLDLIRMVDNRIGEPDDARALLWSQILGPMSLEQALVGMREHYRTSSQTIMPAHITEAADRVLQRWESRKRSHVARNAESIQAVMVPGEIGERDQHVDFEAARSRYSQAKRDAIEYIRSLSPAPRRSAVRARGVVRYRGARSSERAQEGDPARVGSLLPVVQSRVKQPSGDARC